MKNKLKAWIEHMLLKVNIIIAYLEDYIKENEKR